MASDKSIMKNTIIQWCHSTINPVMGCAGCELWIPKRKLLRRLAVAICSTPARPTTEKVIIALEFITADLEFTSQIHFNRIAIIAQLAIQFALSPADCQGLEKVIRSACKCYAGLLGAARPGRPGYANRFEIPKLFPGRMAMASRWAPVSQREVEAKPWLLGLPRMIFISDMGDALSGSVPFLFLKNEIIDAVSSDLGRRHIWLWLSKRPLRMAEFGRWLLAQGVAWPENLVAMTTVTSQDTAGRVQELRSVPSRFKGLSCEPLHSELSLDLTGIDWVIAGGGSDIYAEPFQVEWALKLRNACRDAGAAFFFKQLGRNPFFKGNPLKLVDQHGGDWNEWPEAGWKTRETPSGFR
jgi:protein gp37